MASLLLTLTSFGVCAAESKRVLLLNPYVRDIAPFGAVVSAFRSTLARELGEPVDIHEVPLDLARSIGPEGEGPLVAFLEDRIKGRPVDLVAALGGAGVQFAARHRERLCPHTPVLVLGEPRSVPPGFLETDATLVAQKVDLAGMVEDILQMQPQTRNIFVVFGASDVEKFWVAECRREFQRFSDRVAFTYLNDLPLDQILERCAALPPQSFILHGLFVVDAAGFYCEKNEALRRLHQAANAPLFGLYASEFGLGSVGGRLVQDSDFGATGARVAIRILRGERAESIPPQMMRAAAPVYDWRELQRWSISEARLPVGSVIQFRQPDFWQLYRWPIVGTAAFCLLQAALILGLLANRAKRRQGEDEATLMAEISSKFVNLQPGEVDQEILEAERRICTLLRIDLTALWQWSDEASGFFALTHFYSAKDGPQPTEWNDREDFPWIREEMRAGRIVAFSSPAELPLNAARDREVARQLGIKSSLCLPLSVGGGPTIAVLALNTTRAKRRGRRHWWSGCKSWRRSSATPWPGSAPIRSCVRARN